MIIVRKATIRDAEAIHEMHMRSINDVCKNHYTEKEINAWGNRKFDEGVRKRAITRDYVLVLDDEGEILGFSQFSYKGELCALYLHPKVVKQGYGKKLLHHVENEAKKHKIHKIYLDSSLNAQDFYQSQGFKKVGDQKTILINKENIRCIPMEKDLIGSSKES